MTTPQTTSATRIYLGCDTGPDVDAVGRLVTSLLVAHGIEGGTLWRSVGLYEAQREPALVVELLGVDDDVVERIASDLRERLDQDAVTWTTHEVAQRTVTR